MLLTAEELRQRLQDRRPSIVARATGLSRQAIYFLRKGDHEPSYKTLVALSKYFQENQ